MVAASRDIASIGNVLRHEYDAIERPVLWRIATEDLRPLAAAVDTLLAEVRKTWSKSWTFCA
jgi:uncharacterized protein with HEPN domain